jgi:hypothetical protein
MEKKSTLKKTQQKPDLTLLQAIEILAERSNDSKMSKDFMKSVKTETAFLSKKYGITEQQAVLFAICMDEGPSNVDYRDIARHIDISNIAALALAPDIDTLVHRRLLRYRDVNDEDAFDVPAIVIRCLKHNEVYELPARKGIDCPTLFELLAQWFQDLDDDAISPKELSQELQQLFNDNPQLIFVQKIKQQELSPLSEMLLTKFCYYLVCRNDNDIRFGQMENVFGSSKAFNDAKGWLRRGEHVLQTQNLIEFHCVDGIADTMRYKLTEDAKRELLAEMNVNTTEENIVGVLDPNRMIPKTLFFTDGVEKQVAELKGFFDPERYRAIRERMQQRGFRQGFACLFYGGPGTGKTETVYQLSRETGRALMVVDVPSIRSKWVGESEQNIKAVFDRYRELVKRSELAPILLFNEADALIGTRKMGAQSGVEKMENTMQNIILQEMEDLDGIMIATTNLTENLDPAFERRFLYKILFEKPDAAVRQKIWQQMIPELKTDDAAVLACSFDFSGGQIENIARKHAINSILYGDSPEMLPMLENYCRSEQLSNTVTRKRIGF